MSEISPEICPYLILCCTAVTHSITHPLFSNPLLTSFTQPPLLIPFTHPIYSSHFTHPLIPHPFTPFFTYFTHPLYSPYLFTPFTHPFTQPLFSAPFTHQDASGLQCGHIIEFLHRGLALYPGDLISLQVFVRYLNLIF